MADRAPPTSAAVLISTAILSLITGYMLGIGSSLGLFPNPFQQSPEARTAAKRSKTSNYDDEEESSEEEVDGILLDHAPNWANGEAADVRDGLKIAKKTEKPEWENSTEECKLVLVVRTDLGMTKGACISPASPLTKTSTNTLLFQAKSQLNARTRHWPATSPSYATTRTLQSCGTGKGKGKQKWRCR